MNQCEAPNCGHVIKAGRFLCFRHWMQVPWTLRRRVIAAAKRRGAALSRFYAEKITREQLDEVAAEYEELRRQALLTIVEEVAS